MTLNILKQVNWVDILVITTVLRIIYVAKKNGVPVEFFKILGTISAIYLSAHYYINLSNFVKERLSIENVPIELLDFISFLALAILGYLIFVVVRAMFFRFVNTEVATGLNKYGGLILGGLRGIMLGGLIVFMLVISSVNYFKNSAHSSFFGKRLFKVMPDTYSFVWNKLMSKFMTKEKFNSVVSEVQDNFAQE